jgi:predicted RNase H-like HicB family nuclease
MNTKISIQIEQNETGYSAYSPEIAGCRVEDNSLDGVIDQIKEAIKAYLVQQSVEPQTTGQSLLELFEQVTGDMTDEEIKQLPKDGAEQHNHYIYKTPKQD